MDQGYRKTQGYRNSCFGNKSTLKSWGIAEFVSAAAVSQRFSVNPTLSPGRQPCCHCVFLQANLPAHHLLWEPPQEPARAHAGGRAAPPWSERAGGSSAASRDVRTEGAAAAAAGRAPSTHTCDTAPCTPCPPVLQHGCNTEGQGMYCPNLTLPQLQGFVCPCDTSIRERALFPWLDGRGKLRLCLEYRLHWPGKKSL